MSKDILWIADFQIKLVLFAQVDVFEAAERYQKEGIPLIILAGKDYGSGNSRDWVAKGPYLLVNLNFPVFFFCFFSSCDVYPLALLHLLFLFWRSCLPLGQGVRAVIAESFERLHKNQLVGMGIMPLQFLSEQNADSLELSGKEKFTITMPESLSPRQQLTVKVRNSSSSQRTLSYSFRSDVTPVSCVLADQWRKVLPCHGHVRQRDRRYHLPTRRPPQICRSDFPLKMTPPHVVLSYQLWWRQTNSSPHHLCIFSTAGKRKKKSPPERLSRTSPRRSLTSGLHHHRHRLSEQRWWEHSLGNIFVSRTPLLSPRTRDKMKWILLASVHLTKKQSCLERLKRC